MTVRSVQVVAPSRIHFGMLSFGQPDVPQFGGVGMMVAPPGLRLSITVATSMCAAGHQQRRSLEFARQWAKQSNRNEEPACAIQVHEMPRPHVGLGSGTQLALAIASGLNRFCGRDVLDPSELARSVGRAKRSSVGTFGFVQGGLIVESGRMAAAGESRLEKRVEVPTTWRIVLVCSLLDDGLSGKREREAFSQLPPVSYAATERLRCEVTDHILPSLVDGQFDEFSEAVYRYGRGAGMCFASIQHGAYAGPRQEQLVEYLRSRGVRGVGQTSWGPTLFALTESQADAERLASDLHGHPLANDCELTIARPCNSGAKITAHGHV